MSRFTSLFPKVKRQQRPAYIPFLMLGFPTPELSLHIIDAVILGGADALELGFPFSDPVADGPIIAQCAKSALKNGVTPKHCFEIISKVRQQHPTVAISLLVYANLVLHDGIDSFYRKAMESEVDAVLVPDLPAQEALPFFTQAKRFSIDPILLATPACLDADFLLLSQLSQGYTYVVTRTGVTGFASSDFNCTQKMVSRLKSFNAPPPVFGFGIRRHQDVKEAYANGAEGVIIGSALIHELTSMTAKSLRDGKQVISLTRKLFFGE